VFQQARVGVDHGELALALSNGLACEMRSSVRAQLRSDLSMSYDCGTLVGRSSDMTRRVAIVVAVLVAGGATLFVLGRETPEQRALKERAITEVETRISATQAFDAISVRGSATFHNQGCLAGEDWPKQVGVVEFIDVTEPSPERAELDFCVNTETWEIHFDNDLAKASLIDDTKYIKAKFRCFELTDAKNKARDKLLSSRYGDVFLKVTPSGEDILADDFTCTSTFQLTNSQPAVWKLWPNASTGPTLIPDTAFTPAAKEVEQELERRMTSRCQVVMTELIRDKTAFVEKLYGENYGPEIRPWGADSDDPKLSCQIYYSFGDYTLKTEKYATWSILANATHPEMQAEGDEARAVDRLQAQQ